MTLPELNQLPLPNLKAALTTCCGSTTWVDTLANHFPVDSESQLFDEADRIWQACSESDWREAFTHHPKIGDIDVE